MKDLRPLRNLKIKVKSKKDLKQLQTLYKKCTDTQSNALDSMNTLNSLENDLSLAKKTIEKKREEIEQLEALVKEGTEKYKELVECLQTINEDMASENEDLLKFLVETSMSNISMENIFKINNNLKKTGAFAGKTCEDFIVSGIKEGFDLDLVDKYIIIEKPSPMLTKVLMKKEYDKRDARYKKLKGISEKKQSTLKSKKEK